MQDGKCEGDTSQVTEALIKQESERNLHVDKHPLLAFFWPPEYSLFCMPLITESSTTLLLMK